MRKLINGLIKDVRGVTAMEYGLIAGFIALGIIGALGVAGPALAGIFNTIATQLQTAAAAVGG